MPANHDATPAFSAPAAARTSTSHFERVAAAGLAVLYAIWASGVWILMRYWSFEPVDDLRRWLFLLQTGLDFDRFMNHHSSLAPGLIFVGGILAIHAGMRTFSRAGFLPRHWLWVVVAIHSLAWLGWDTLWYLRGWIAFDQPYDLRNVGLAIVEFTEARLRMFSMATAFLFSIYVPCVLRRMCSVKGSEPSSLG